MNNQRKTSVTIMLLLLCFGLTAQQTNSSQKRKAQLTPLPALSYSPETGITMGFIGDYYFDLAKGDTTVSRSKVRLLTTYTTSRQFIFEPSWALYTLNDNYRTSGSLLYRNFNDRNYGFGNSAESVIVNYKEKDEIWEADTTNFQKFWSKRIWIKANVLKKIVPNLYVGLQIELDYVFDVENDTSTVVQETKDFQNITIKGFRSGIGLNLTYDSRNKPNYPITGSYVQLSNYFISTWLGSDVTYTALGLDARQYFNIYKDHVLAIRLFSDHRFGGNIQHIPIRGLSRFGGKDLVRGYFFGSYQDRHLLTFAGEYRLPFTFLEKSFLPLLGRLGMVAFLSGGQVYGEYNQFQFGDFHLAAGGGLRVNINKNETTNIRIDYGFGLTPNSAYYNKRQSALYFYLSEAF